MLQQALNRHSQIVIPPETKFFFSFVGCSQKCQAKQLARINADLGIGLPLPDKRIVATGAARAIYDELASRYVRRLGRCNVAYFGDKTPEQTGRLWRMRWLFPTAKFIFIYRDGRDVALSLSKVPWMAADLYVNFMIWLYYYRILRRARNEGRLDIIFVRYEDIVINPIEELRRVLAFLGLSYESAVAEGYGNHEGIPLREYPWKSRALGRITDDRIGTWRHELSDTQVKHLEVLGGKALRDLGYETSTNGRARLPLRVRARLCLNGLRLMYRLPWQALAAEVLETCF